MKRWIIFVMVMLCIVPVSHAGIWDFLTIGRADARYCRLYGDCEIANLTVTNFVNFTVTDYYVNGNMNITGNISASFYCNATHCNTVTAFLADTDTTIGNCSVAGVCSDVCYMDYDNTGDLNISGNLLAKNASLDRLDVTTINNIGITDSSPTSITFKPSNGLSTSELVYSSTLPVGWILTNLGKTLSILDNTVLNQSLTTDDAVTFKTIKLYLANLGGGDATEEWFKIYQGADSRGIELWGFDDRDDEWLRFMVGSAGQSMVQSSNAFGYTVGSYMAITIGSDFYLTLGDAAGSKKFYLRDSGNAKVATFNSNGWLTLGSSSVPSYPLEVWEDTSDISIWAEKNVSAAGYLTRTSVFDSTKNPFDYIKDSSYYLDGKGDIIHENFYGYAGEFNITDKSRSEIIEVCEDITGEYICFNETIYPYNKVEKAVSLDEEVNVLRQAVYESKQENQMLKDCIINSKDFIELKECVK